MLNLSPDKLILFILSLEPYNTNYLCTSLLFLFVGKVYVSHISENIQESVYRGTNIPSADFFLIYMLACFCLLSLSSIIGC